MKVLKSILILIMFTSGISPAFSASQSIWGSTDRGPVVGTYRLPVDTGASSSPGYISAAELNTFINAGTTGHIQYNASGSLADVTLTTTGTSGAATFSAGTLNIPQYSNSTFQQSMAAETQLNLGGL